MHGGYLKEVFYDKNSSEKGEMPASSRAGFSMCVHNKWTVLFGRVLT